MKQKSVNSIYSPLDSLTVTNHYANYLIQELTHGGMHAPCIHRHTMGQSALGAFKCLSHEFAGHFWLFLSREDET